MEAPTKNSGGETLGAANSGISSIASLETVFAQPKRKESEIPTELSNEQLAQALLDKADQFEKYHQELFKVPAYRDAAAEILRLPNGKSIAYSVSNDPKENLLRDVIADLKWPQHWIVSGPGKLRPPRRRSILRPDSPNFSSFVSSNSPSGVFGTGNSYAEREARKETFRFMKMFSNPDLWLNPKVLDRTSPVPAFREPRPLTPFPFENLGEPQYSYLDKFLNNNPTYDDGTPRVSTASIIQALIFGGVLVGGGTLPAWDDPSYIQGEHETYRENLERAKHPAYRREHTKNGCIRQTVYVRKEGPILPLLTFANTNWLGSSSFDTASIEDIREKFEESRYPHLITNGPQHGDQLRKQLALLRRRQWERERYRNAVWNEKHLVTTAPPSLPRITGSQAGRNSEAALSLYNYECKIYFRQDLISGLSTNAIPTERLKYTTIFPTKQVGLGNGQEPRSWNPPEPKAEPLWCQKVREENPPFGKNFFESPLTDYKYFLPTRETLFRFPFGRAEATLDPSGTQVRLKRAWAAREERAESGEEGKLIYKAREKGQTTFTILSVADDDTLLNEALREFRTLPNDASEKEAARAKNSVLDELAKQCAKKARAAFGKREWEEWMKWNVRYAALLMAGAAPKGGTGWSETFSGSEDIIPSRSKKKSIDDRPSLTVMPEDESSSLNNAAIEKAPEDEAEEIQIPYADPPLVTAEDDEEENDRKLVENDQKLEVYAFGTLQADDKLEPEHLEAEEKETGHKGETEDEDEGDENED